MPPTDDKNKSGQPNFDKSADQTARDMPNKDGTSAKDEDVKGGRMRQSPKDVT